MKSVRYYSLLLLLFAAVSTNAQTWDEWVHQDRTQLKYLREQIVALKVYLDYAKEGYAIVKNGLTLIGDTRHVDLALHDEHFAARRKVSPSIASSTKAVAIATDLVKIGDEARRTLNDLRNANVFSKEEKSAVENVLNNVRRYCVRTAGELVMLLTDGQYSMKDDERWKRIDVLYNETKTHYAFVVSYATEAGLLSLQRKHEEAALQVEKRLSNR